MNICLSVSSKHIVWVLNWVFNYTLLSEGLEWIPILIWDAETTTTVCYFPGSLILIEIFLSLYTARPSFEYYRQVYFVHSGFKHSFSMH